jgi:hypothetical protein
MPEGRRQSDCKAKVSKLKLYLQIIADDHVPTPQNAKQPYKTPKMSHQNLCFHPHPFFRALPFS